MSVDITDPLDDLSMLIEHAQLSAVARLFNEIADLVESHPTGRCVGCGEVMRPALVLTHFLVKRHCWPSCDATASAEKLSRRAAAGLLEDSIRRIADHLEPTVVSYLLRELALAVRAHSRPACNRCGRPILPPLENARAAWKRRHYCSSRCAARHGKTGAVPAARKRRRSAPVVTEAAGSAQDYRRRGFSAAEQAAIEEAIAAGRVTRIEGPSRFDGGLLDRAGLRLRRMTVMDEP